MAGFRGDQRPGRGKAAAGDVAAFEIVSAVQISPGVLQLRDRPRSLSLCMELVYYYSIVITRLSIFIYWTVEDLLELYKFYSIIYRWPYIRARAEDNVRQIPVIQVKKTKIMSNVVSGTKRTRQSR